jgi:hypothetical protein
MLGFIRSWISRSTRTPVLASFPYGEGLLVSGLVHQALFQWLSRFYLFSVLTILHRVSGVGATSHGTPTHPEIPPGGR